MKPLTVELPAPEQHRGSLTWGEQLALSQSAVWHDLTRLGVYRPGPPPWRMFDRLPSGRARSVTPWRNDHAPTPRRLPVLGREALNRLMHAIRSEQHYRDQQRVAVDLEASEGIVVSVGDKHFLLDRTHLNEGHALAIQRFADHTSSPLVILDHRPARPGVVDEHTQVLDTLVAGLIARNRTPKPKS